MHSLFQALKLSVVANENSSEQKQTRESEIVEAGVSLPRPPHFFLTCSALTRLTEGLEQAIMCITPLVEHSFENNYKENGVSTLRNQNQLFCRDLVSDVVMVIRNNHIL